MWTKDVSFIPGHGSCYVIFMDGYSYTSMASDYSGTNVSTYTRDSCVAANSVSFLRTRFTGGSDFTGYVYSKRLGRQLSRQDVESLLYGDTVTRELVIRGKTCFKFHLNQHTRWLGQGLTADCAVPG